MAGPRRPPTLPQGVPAYVGDEGSDEPRHRHHTPPPIEIGSPEARLAVAESQLNEIFRRLREGNKSMEDLRLADSAVETRVGAALKERLAEIAVSMGKVDLLLDQLRPKPMSIAKVAAWALPFVALFGGLIWQASRYPERVDLEKVAAKVTEIDKADGKRDTELHDVRELAQRVLDSILGGKVRP